MVVLRERGFYFVYYVFLLLGRKFIFNIYLLNKLVEELLKVFLDCGEFIRVNVSLWGFLGISRKSVFFGGILCIVVYYDFWYW